MASQSGTIPYVPEYAQPETDAHAHAGIGAGTVIVLSALMIGVLLMSIFFFSGQSLRLDEAQSLWQTSRTPLAMFTIIAEDVHVPLYHIMLHYWQAFFGNGVAVGRMLSLIFFMLMIPAMYFIGRRIYSHAVGMFGAALVALSPFLNWYGNEIRMYSIFALFTVINQYFFMRIFMESDDGRAADARGSLWFGYIATMVIGMFTHYFFVFNAITQAIFFFMYRRRFPRSALLMFILSAVLLMVLFAPWLYFVYHLGSAANTQPALAKPTTIDVFNTFSEFIFGFQNDHTNTILVSLWPLLVLLIFLSLRRNQKVAPQTVYLFMSLFVPILLAFAISNEWKPIYLSRYLILTLPSLYLLMSWIISTYPRQLAFALKSLIVIVMAGTMAIEVANADTPVKEDYREASAVLTEKATPEDVIVLSAPFTVYPFEYYYRGPSQVDTLPIWNQYLAGPIPQFSPTELTKDAAVIKDSHQTLWLLLSYDQGYEQQIRMYFDTHFERVYAQNFSPGLELYGYRLRYDDTSLGAALKEIQQGQTGQGTVASNE